MSLYSHARDPSKWYYDMCEVFGCYCWKVRSCQGPPVRTNYGRSVAFFWLETSAPLEEDEIEQEYL